MSKNNVMKQIVMPILVLTIICMTCSAALAATYQTTKPTIAAAEAAAAEAARLEVFPGATEFVKCEGALPEGITEAFTVPGTKGMVITATTKGFGGPIEVMTGIGDNGEILGLKVLKMTETSGLGTQIEEPWNLERYVGQTNVDGVETISGSTVSSAALKRLEQSVLQAYQELSGGAAA